MIWPRSAPPGIRVERLQRPQHQDAPGIDRVGVAHQPLDVGDPQLARPGGRAAGAAAAAAPAAATVAGVVEQLRPVGPARGGRRPGRRRPAAQHGVAAAPASATAWSVPVLVLARPGSARPRRRRRRPGNRARRCRSPARPAAGPAARRMARLSHGPASGPRGQDALVEPAQQHQVGLDQPAFELAQDGQPRVRGPARPHRLRSPSGPRAAPGRRCRGTGARRSAGQLQLGHELARGRPGRPATRARRCRPRRPRATRRRPDGPRAARRQWCRARCQQPLNAGRGAATASSQGRAACGDGRRCPGLRVGVAQQPAPGRRGHRPAAARAAVPRSRARTRRRNWPARCRPASGCLSAESSVTGDAPPATRCAVSSRNVPGGDWSSGTPALSSTRMPQRSSSAATRRPRPGWA